MTIELTAGQIELMKQALDATEGSMKRAINTKKDPRFTALYERDIATINEIRVALQGAPLDQDAAKKK